ncbi:hypothetical protein EI42_05879 [Thermosporothrix hazakensis]|jgi:predicted Rossmann-fold nucleotide-binding protein|uniref:Cytokinin riboside 5'-monophosphate phosphoribohydrolase n=1 Tax=Thermosporothrix hazakensis TaxID=644383 RepID=A0A326TWL2_THEHA|nr:LOG family protein [Thermosporothrix hazakensis]PZW20733.1 hypothetical protein EI42_05879 [Thermosporothrix hazakensis]GCE49861.1 cytokinin riboside 5'-monophosphate phosphoribohydrolase [Thermosporothrix hazakensis]
MYRICLFAGSSPGPDCSQHAALQLGQAIAHRRWSLIYTTTPGGLAELAASAAQAAGGETIHLKATERDLQSELFTVQFLLQLADAIVVLPGGLETFTSLFELLRWKQRGWLAHKPLGLLNTHGYFKGILYQLQRAHLFGFEEAHPLLYLSSDPALLLDMCSQKTAGRGA